MHPSALEAPGEGREPSTEGQENSVVVEENSFEGQGKSAEGQEQSVEGQGNSVEGQGASTERGLEASVEVGWIVLSSSCVYVPASCCLRLSHLKDF